MKRDDILAEIADNLPTDYVVAANPDHPDLLEGPDILAGRNGTLLAIFVPKPTEQRHPERLTARLILAKLALPNHTRFMLALDEEPGSALPLEALRPHFNATIAASSESRMRREIRKTDLDRTMPVPGDVRRLAHERSAFLLDLTESLSPTYRQYAAVLRGAEELAAGGNGAANDSAPGRALVTQVPRPLPEDALSAALAQLGRATIVRNVIVAEELPYSRRAGPLMLTRYFAPLVNLTYSLKDGVPYVRHHIAALLLQSNVVLHDADPLKPFRAAAFAGWAIAERLNRHDQDEVIDKLASWLEQEVGERP